MQNQIGVQQKKKTNSGTNTNRIANILALLSILVIVMGFIIEIINQVSLFIKNPASSMTLGMNIADLLKGCIAFSFFPTICLILIRLKTPRKTISAMIIVNLVLLGVQLLSTIIYTALYFSDVDYSIIYFLYCLPGSGLFVQLYAFFKTGSLTLLILITLPKMCYFAKNILSFIALIKAKKAEPLIQPTKIAEPTKAPLTHKTSAADIEELKRYKELLDTGAITQEEFDAKKKQLLEL